MFNPLDFPICWQYCSFLWRIESAWIEHIPFGSAIVEMARPRCIVELGVHHGASYLTFCQAVKSLELDTRCYGVDTWEGDGHAGYYSGNVLDRLKACHDSHFGTFSRLVQAKFDKAADDLADGEVDLLHIDGLHTYEAVRHDFETWRPKLSQQAVVLFHDTSVRDRGFGVWKLWQELSNQYPSFHFDHGYGLGVLGYGMHLPPAVQSLFGLDESKAMAVRLFYGTLGSQLSLSLSSQALEDRLAAAEANLAIYRSSPTLRFQHAMLRSTPMRTLLRALKSRR